jgi:trehalose-6-phosphate synthase
VMPAAERRVRMQRMRAVVKENNVYRWAGNLIGELAEIRLGTSERHRPRAARISDLSRNGQLSREDVPAPTR